MDPEAIQQDAQAEDQNLDQGPEQTQETAVPEAPAQKEDPRSARERKMAEVAEKRIAEREEARKAAALMDNPDLTEEEFDAQQVASPEGEATQEDVSSDALEDGDGPETPVAEDLGTDVPEKQDAVPAGWDRRDDGVLVKRLKVNGEIKELTQDEYDRQLSKELAGDQKLRIAAEMEQRLRQREEELARREQQFQQPPQQDAVPDIDSALDEFVGAIYEGDSDAAKAKMKAIIEQGRQSSTPNMDQLVSTAATQVQATIAEERRKQDQIDGWNAFESEYGDIAGSDRLMAYADVVLKEVQAEKPEASISELYMETGKRTREQLGLNKQPVPRADANRENRKANLKPVPKAGSTVDKPKPTPQVDMSAAAKIARMRQSRALA